VIDSSGHGTTVVDIPRFGFNTGPTALPGTVSPDANAAVPDGEGASPLGGSVGPGSALASAELDIAVPST